jgi:hypothetical protein
MNFPTHIPVHPEFMTENLSPLILHHHHRLTGDGLLEYSSYTSVNLLIDHFNLSLHEIP